MVRQIKKANYTFTPGAEGVGTLEFLEYAENGIDWASVLTVQDVSTGLYLYNWSDPSKLGEVVEGENILTFNIDTSGFDADAPLKVLYDDDDAPILVEQYAALDSSDDSVSTRPEGTVPKNLTASGAVSTLPEQIAGFICNSTGGGTIKLWDNTSAASGDVLNGTMTPVAGQYYPLGDFIPLLGVYAQITGTLDVTFYKYPST